VLKTRTSCHHFSLQQFGISLFGQPVSEVEQSEKQQKKISQEPTFSIKQSKEKQINLH
jgi:hypothetical protein